MSGSYFLDTNIIIYSLESSVKQKIAIKLIETALLDQKGIISHQVVQETLNVLLKPSVNISTKKIQILLNLTLKPLCHIYPDINLYHHALQINQRYQFSFYDALIIAAAIKGECTILYSEDLQHDQKIDFLTIKNPFIV